MEINTSAIGWIMLALGTIGMLFWLIPKIAEHTKEGRDTRM